MKLKSLALTLSVVAPLALSLAGCDWDLDQTKTSDPDDEIMQPIQTPHQVIPQTVWRNPATNNGETSRQFTKDAKGNIVKIDIGYAATSPYKRGTVFKDAAGHVTRLLLVESDGYVVDGVPSADGKQIVRSVYKGLKGELIETIDPTDAGGFKLTHYAADGKTVVYAATFTQSKGDGADSALITTIVADFFQKDGKTPLAHLEERAGIRRGLKLYDTEGRLTYDEQIVGNPADRVQFVGKVYDAGNKLTHRVSISEGSFDTGSGHVDKIETLANDGVKVKSTDTLDKSANQPPHALGVFADQSQLLKQKRDIWQSLHTTTGNKMSEKDHLLDLLRD